MSDNVFTRHEERNNQKPNLEIVGETYHQEDTDRLPDYEAVEMGQGHTRFEMILKDQTSILVSYGYVTKVIVTSDQYLSIITTDTVFTLEGMHLGTLRKKLRSDKIEVIHTWRPDLYAPPEDNEPVVTDIIIESHKEAQRVG